MKLIITAFSLAFFMLISFGCGDKKNAQTYSELSDLSTSKEATIATPTPEMIAKGQEIFNGKGICHTCHKADTKLIGPSLKDIATKYTAENASIFSFLREQSHSIVDTTASQVALMKTNFPTLKNMTDDEIKNLEAFVLSHK